MKLKLFLTVLLCSLSLVVQAQRGARIAYIDMDIILSKNKEFRTANQLLDEKIVQWKKEIELKNPTQTHRGSICCRKNIIDTRTDR